MRVSIAAFRANWYKLLLVGVALLGAAYGGRNVPKRGMDIPILLVSGLAFIVVLMRPRVGLYAMLLLVPLQNVVVFETGGTLVRLVGIGVAVAWGGARLTFTPTCKFAYNINVVTDLTIIVNVCFRVNDVSSRC